MSKNGKPPVDDYLFAPRLAKWIKEGDHERVVTVLAMLRYEPFSVQEALETLLAMPTIRTLKMSFELWEAMLEQDGVDIEALLLAQLPTHTLRLLRLALWGETTHPSTGARLRVLHLK